MAEYEQTFNPNSVMGKITEVAIARLTTVNIQHKENDDGKSVMLPIYSLEESLRDTITATGNESDKTTGIIDVAIEIIKESGLKPENVIGGIHKSSGSDWNLFFLDLATTILKREFNERYPKLEKDTLDQIWLS